MVIPNIGAFMPGVLLLRYLFPPVGCLTNIRQNCRPDDYLFIARDDWFYSGHLVGGKRGAVMGGIGTIGGSLAQRSRCSLAQ